MQRVAAVCPYFRDSLVEGIVRDLEGAAAIHLWALDDHVPPACAPFVRGRGPCHRLRVFNELLPLCRDFDGVLFVNDDVELGPRFLARFLPIVEQLGGDIAQPARTCDSFCNFEINRQQPGCRARRTNFVEAGPVVYMAAQFLRHAAPFPVPRVMSWGIDLLWADLARRHGLRMLVVDATPVRDAYRPIASLYSREEAWASLLEFVRAHRVPFQSMDTLETFADVPGESRRW